MAEELKKPRKSRLWYHYNNKTTVDIFVQTPDLSVQQDDGSYSVLNISLSGTRLLYTRIGSHIREKLARKKEIEEANPDMYKVMTNYKALMDIYSGTSRGERIKNIQEQFDELNRLLIVKGEIHLLDNRVNLEGRIVDYNEHKGKIPGGEIAIFFLEANMVDKVVLMREISYMRKKGIKYELKY